MKTKEIIQRVQSLYSKGVQSQSTRLRPRHIYNKLITVRSLLLSQDAKSRKKISQWNYQTIDCVELVKKKKHECSCVILSDCDYILRTKYKLPKPLLNYTKHLIQGVFTVDYSKKISEVQYEFHNSNKGNRYTSNEVSFFFKDGHIYILNTLKLKAITITGLFDDPNEVENYKGVCKNSDCEDCNKNENGECESILDKEFPIDNDKIEVLVQMSLNELIQAFSSLKDDKSNNQQDEEQKMRGN